MTELELFNFLQSHLKVEVQRTSDDYGGGNWVDVTIKLIHPETKETVDITTDSALISY